MPGPYSLDPRECVVQSAETGSTAIRSRFGLMRRWGTVSRLAEAVAPYGQWRAHHPSERSW
jgi:hypothetical protein